MPKPLPPKKINAPERWLPIPGFDGWYDVSDHGRIRTWRKRGLGSGSRLDEPAYLMIRSSSAGYPVVNLYMDGSGSRPYTIHVLVLSTFVGPRPTPRHQGSHIDGNRTRSCLSNLAWETPKQNEGRKKSHGTAPVGSQNPFAKLTEDRVKAIRERYATDPSATQAALAAEYGVTQTAISDIIAARRGSWAHAGGPVGTGRTVAPPKHFGEANNATKLTAADVLAIRLRADQGERLKEIAVDYDMTYNGVLNIVNRKTWKHVE